MTKKKKNTIPEALRAPKLIKPVFQALLDLGGSGTNGEILDKVIEIAKIPEANVSLLHTGKHLQTELDYGCAWARTYLRYAGYISTSSRGVWAINAQYINAKSDKLAPTWAIIKAFRENKTVDEVLAENPGGLKEVLPFECETDTPADADGELPLWKEQLLGILKGMNPYSFEVLSQRLLRECGFENVRVTKKSGDGGIDGLAILKINGIFSFSIAFQCKRYDGKVGAPAIRDFRGSLASDIEKGVFITTGLFTAEAKAEAFAPGKKQIDLVDGNTFMDKLAECQIGLKEIIRKDYEIDLDFFEHFETPKK